MNEDKKGTERQRRGGKLFMKKKERKEIMTCVENSHNIEDKTEKNKFKLKKKY